MPEPSAWVGLISCRLKLNNDVAKSGGVKLGLAWTGEAEHGKFLSLFIDKVE
jgi:hypothetical protein